MSTTMRTVQLLDFEPIADQGFINWLAENNHTVLVSHTNKIIGIGRDQHGFVQVEQALFDRVTGLAVGPSGAISVAAHHEVWTMSDATDAGTLSPRGAQRWLMCRNARFVGGARPADLAPTDDDCWFVSVTLSALCSLDQTLSARVRWLPPFITAAVPEMRCRLTGLGMLDGRPAVVTSASTCDDAGGWSMRQANGGVLIDIASGEVIVAGLSMPHSPRWHNGAWWLLQAGTGELGYIDDGRFNAVARVDGFARGLTFVGNTAAIGGSGSRWDELVNGLAVGERLKASGSRPESGVFVVDTHSGARVGNLVLDGTAREISDVIVLAGTRMVELSGPRGISAQDFTTYPELASG